MHVLVELDVKKVALVLEVVERSRSSLVVPLDGLILVKERIVRVRPDMADLGTLEAGPSDSSITFR